MTKRRIAAWSAAICIAGIVGTVALLSGASNFIFLSLYAGIYDRALPQRISWDAKNAWLKCPGAIADSRQWPAGPARACAAMYLCVNEGALSERQMQALHEQIRKTPECRQP